MNITTSFNTANTRREYESEKLNYSDLTEHPMTLFSIWLNQAYLFHIPDPTAMCLATVDHIGQPYQRLVLLKKFTHTKITFYTHLNSRKSTHLTKNSKVSVCFPWNAMNRQITITGNVYLLSKRISKKYFYTRPHNSQISTWVSQQSKIIHSENMLQNKFLKLQKKYSHKKVPFPNFWGGYQININSIEFWQGRKYRLHDRFIYKRCKNRWSINRLAP